MGVDNANVGIKGYVAIFSPRLLLLTLHYES